MRPWRDSRDSRPLRFGRLLQEPNDSRRQILDDDELPRLLLRHHAIVIDSGLTLARVQLVAANRTGDHRARPVESPWGAECGLGQPLTALRIKPVRVDSEDYPIPEWVQYEGPAVPIQVSET